MSFQKLTALVALVVLASQGTMATAVPPQNAADTVLSNAGQLAGAVVPALLPSNYIKEAIEGAGGVPGDPSPSPPQAAGPQDVADDLVDNSGKLTGAVVAAISPNNLVDQGIKEAGGTPGGKF